MKSFLKAALSLFMRIAAFPLYALYRLEAVFVGKRKAFGAMSQWAAIAPGISGEWFRRACLQWATGLALKDCCFGFGSTFSDPRVKIGDGVYVGRGCDIGWAEIGPNCLFGSGVHILSGQGQHNFADPSVPVRDQGGEFSKVIVGEDAWIGNGAIVAADVGRKCVIGAGAVVVKPIPDYAVAVGNPARVIRYRGGAGE